MVAQFNALIKWCCCIASLCTWFTDSL